MIDFNRGALKAGEAVPSSEMLDGAAAALMSAPRAYLGGSRLGEECARKLQFEFRGAKRKPIPAKTHNVFAIGHASEDAVAEMLKQIFDLRTAKPDGRQFGFSVANDRIAGHIDGVVCGGPAELGPYPYLWEAKAVAHKYWMAIKRNGVAKERPVYAGQVATYQAYMGLTDNPALFSVCNRDTGEVHFERLPFNAQLAQECSDRGVAVLQAEEAGELMPRPYPDSEFYLCRFCDFNEECWADD